MTGFNTWEIIGRKHKAIPRKRRHLYGQTQPIKMNSLCEKLLLVAVCKNQKFMFSAKTIQNKKGNKKELLFMKTSTARIINSWQQKEKTTGTTQADRLEAQT